MSTCPLLRGVALGAVLALGSGVACAQEPQAPPAVAEEEAAPPRLPLPYAERPLTLPQLVLSPYLEGYAARGDSTFFDLTLAAAFGITRDFEVEAIVAPLQLAPKTATYGQADQPGPALGFTLRLASGAGEVGLHLDGTYISLPAASGAVLRPGIPLRFHAGSAVRIDCGAFLDVTLAQTVTTGLALPFALGFDVTPPLHFGFNSGFVVPSVNSVNVNVPLGVFGGYAIGGKNGPILDIDPFFRWPSIAGNDAQGESKIDQFQAGVELTGFFYL